MTFFFFFFFVFRLLKYCCVINSKLYCLFWQNNRANRKTQTGLTNAGKTGFNAPAAASHNKQEKKKKRKLEEDGGNAIKKLKQGAGYSDISTEKDGTKAGIKKSKKKSGVAVPVAKTTKSVVDMKSKGTSPGSVVKKGVKSSNSKEDSEELIEGSGIKTKVVSNGKPFSSKLLSHLLLLLSYLPYVEDTIWILFCFFCQIFSKV